MGCGGGGLLWRRIFFVWEEELVDELMGVLALVTITTLEDRWSWNPGGEEGFTVKSTYVFLDHTTHPSQQLSSLLSFAFKFVWKCGVPSKVSAFAWQLLLDRLPTRDNLRRRRVVSAEGSISPFCLVEVESATHLFLHCRIAADIWYEIMRWLGVVLMLPPSVPLSYAVLVGCGLNKRRRKCFSIIWLAFIWVLWRTRNEYMFLIMWRLMCRVLWIVFNDCRGNGFYMAPLRNRVYFMSGFGAQPIV
jgi:hypothetical protein